MISLNLISIKRLLNETNLEPNIVFEFVEENGLFAVEVAPPKADAPKGDPNEFPNIAPPCSWRSLLLNTIPG